MAGYPEGVTDEQTRSVSRAERVLAYLLIVFVAAAIIAFFAIMIGSASGMSQESFDTPVWRVVAFVPWVGLPLAFVMLFALVIIGGRGRSAANRLARQTGSGS